MPLPAGSHLQQRQAHPLDFRRQVPYSPDENEYDHIPDDAINQMHRYRDALIHLEKADDGITEKSRPVVGAFVLYPASLTARMV